MQFSKVICIIISKAGKHLKRIHFKICIEFILSHVESTVQARLYGNPLFFPIRKLRKKIWGGGIEYGMSFTYEGYFS
jgi:hypothetical protein